MNMTGARLTAVWTRAALVACLLVATSIGQLGRHLPSAGGLYLYVARGIGSTVGFLVAWVPVRMVLKGQLPVGLVDLFVRGIPRNSESLVVVMSGHSSARL